MILKWGFTLEDIEFVSYPLSGCTLFTGYTHLGDKVEGEIKTIRGMQVSGNGSGMAHLCQSPAQRGGG